MLRGFDEIEGNNHITPLNLGLYREVYLVGEFLEMNGVVPVKSF